VRYGLTHPIGNSSPLTVHLFEPGRLWSDLCETPRWGDRLRRLWNPPDWRPSAGARKGEKGSVPSTRNS